MYRKSYPEWSSCGQLKRQKLTKDGMEVSDKDNPGVSHMNFGQVNTGVSPHTSRHEHNSSVNNMFKFAVVRYLDEGGELGIVSTNWIDYENNVCFFPNVKSDKIRRDLLKARLDPSDGWMRAHVNILKQFVAYSLAKCYLKDVEESWLDSNTLHRRRTERLFNNEDRDSSPEEREPTKVKSSLWYPSPEIYYEDRPPTTIGVVTPQQPAKPARGKEKAVLGNREMNNISQSTGNNTISPVYNNSSSLPAPNFDTPFMVHNARRDPIAALSNQVKRLETNQSLMWDVINILKDKVNSTDHKSHQIVPLVTIKKEASNSISNESMDFFSLLPVSEENLPRFEELLASNTGFKEALVRMLVHVGGNSLRTVAANGLRKLISDDAAELFTLTGKSRQEKEKMSFEKTRMFQLVKDLCFKKCNPDISDNAEAKVREAVSNWLLQAKFRKDRRESRVSECKENILEEGRDS